ncbi:hypothetical protein, partial [Herbaspirillum sp.]|uniref:hypothetical protein n=1 Tax=Herbaspirillum sp. TaxID=1890675 RepID=UPI00258EDC8E
MSLRYIGRSADIYDVHTQKCCTTKYLHGAGCALFIGTILMLVSWVNYTANELEYWRDAQFVDDCYVAVSMSTCSSSAGSYTYTVSPDNTCVASTET